MTGDFIPRSASFCSNGGCRNKTNDFCASCGFNVREAARRKELQLVKFRDGRRGKQITKQRMPNRLGRRVISIDPEGNKVEYPTIKDAAAAVRGFEGNISNALRGISQSAYGYVWRYAEEGKDEPD